MIEKERLQRAMLKYGLNLSENQLDLLDKYAELLVEWNGRMNLTAITDSEGIEIRHFEDSLAPAAFVEIPHGARVIDVGAGAGFPSMVLKIFRPDISLTLVESVKKKTQFLEALALELGFDDVSILNVRAEEAGKNALYREKFDICCARAVAALPTLLEYCIPFVAVGGKFAALKGPNVQVEIEMISEAVRQLGLCLPDAIVYNLSDGSQRNLLVFEKTKPTPAKFPRSSARIAKNPLIGR